MIFNIKIEFEQASTIIPIIERLSFKNKVISDMIIVTDIKVTCNAKNLSIQFEKNAFLIKSILDFIEKDFLSLNSMEFLRKFHS